MIEERADLVFECNAAIHPGQIESAKHLFHCAAIQALCNLIEELRGGLFGEGIVFRLTVLRVSG